MPGRLRIPWIGKRGESASDAEPEAAPVAPPAAPQRPAPPLARPADPPHHWLTVLVARHGPVGLVPAPGARVVVRPFPRGATEPGEPVGRGTASADGTLALLLPPGRYAVAAAHQGDGRSVTVTLEHAGRATIVLESLARRVRLTVEASGPDGFALTRAPIEIRSAAGGALVQHGATDDVGIATLHVPPGAYEVIVGGARVRTYVEADTRLRVATDLAPDQPATPAADAQALPPTPASPYAQKVRAATTYAAPFHVSNVRDDGWN